MITILAPGILFDSCWGDLCADTLSLLTNHNYRYPN